MTDLERRRLTVRVLELLDESFRASRDGDMPRCGLLVTEAVRLDVEAVVVIQGGMVIGEIPRPDIDYREWHDYLTAARDALYEAERQESTTQDGGGS